jgi:hypothetical protein
MPCICLTAAWKYSFRGEQYNSNKIIFNYDKIKQNKLLTIGTKGAIINKMINRPLKGDSNRWHLH